MQCKCIIWGSQSWNSQEKPRIAWVALQEQVTWTYALGNLRAIIHRHSRSCPDCVSTFWSIHKTIHKVDSSKTTTTTTRGWETEILWSLSLQIYNAFEYTGSSDKQILKRTSEWIGQLIVHIEKRETATTNSLLLHILQAFKECGI